MTDDLKKDALKALIPQALEQTVKEVIMFRNMREDPLSAAQIKTISMERIAGDVMNQVIGPCRDAEAFGGGASSSGGRLGQQLRLQPYAGRRREERLRQGQEQGRSQGQRQGQGL